MTMLIVLAIITALLLWYALWGRDWLKTKPWAQGFFAWIEPIEITLFKKSETILVARMLQALGGILTTLTWLGEIPIEPLMPLVPDEYVGMVRAGFTLLPLVLNLLGGTMERLRNKTTKPLVLVAVPDKVVAENPQVAEAVAAAEAVKTEAVATVEQAKEA